MDYDTIIQNLTHLSEKEKCLLLNIMIRIQNDVNVQFGYQGGQWEINLRDVYRIYDGFMHTDRSIESLLHIVLIVMAYRFRNADDFKYVIALINEELQKDGAEISDISRLRYPTLTTENDRLRIG